MEAPEYQSGFCTQFVTEKRHSIDNKAAGGGGGDHFMVEDLLDFSNDDDAVIAADTPFVAAATTTAGNSTDSSTVTVVDSCNSSSFSGCDPNFVSDIGCRNFPDANFSSDLCVPYDDLAELEWLSNFVEESFSSEDLQKLQMISGMKARTVDETSETTPQHEPSNRNSNSPIFRPEMSVPAKARSKRSRAAPCNWTSRLLVLSQQSPSSSPPQPSLPPSELDRFRDVAVAKKTVKVAAYSKRKDGVESGGDGRKCLHCATDKTPQWRTGPMGPKTLCNACGVRYKSGRLVPEYRPAASPTFMLTKHSNSHRKVLELRRQKEMMRTHHHHHHHQHHQQQHQQQHQHQHQQQQFLHHHHQNMVFDVTNGGDDYLIHSHVGPDFRQLI